MIRKNIFYALLMVATGSLLSTACMFDQEDLFDEGASQRMTHFNEGLQSKLVAQSTNGNQGWVIQYFVGNSSIEGFNLFGSFTDDNQVTLASDHRYLRSGKAGNYTEYKSSYQMLAEEGPILSFNTWNDVLTVFADPVDPSNAPTSIINDGEGMSGDYNLVFKAYEGNNIVFRGERHSAEVRFVPCDRPWQTYIDDVAAMKKKISNSTLTSYYLTDGKDTMFYSGLNTGIVYHVDRVEDPLQSSVFSCLFTPEGFRINHKDTLAGNSFQEFKISADNTHLDSEDGKTKLIPAWDTYIWGCSSIWKIDADNFTAEQTALFQQMAAEVKKVNAKFELDSIAIGRMTETETYGSLTERVVYPALILCVHGPAKMGRTPQYKPYCNMNIDKPEFGKLKFSQSDVTRSNDNMDMFAATDLKTLCLQFAATLYGTYTMQPDDCFRPTQATLTPDNGGNTIKLVLKAIAD